MGSTPENNGRMLPKPHSRRPSIAPNSKTANTPPALPSAARGSATVSKAAGVLRRVAESDNLRANAMPTPPTTSPTSADQSSKSTATYLPSQKSRGVAKFVKSGAKRGPSDGFTTPSMAGQGHVSPIPVRSVSGVKRTLGEGRDTSESEGSEPRNKKPPNKKHRPAGVYKDRYFIGHHVDEPRISIYAKSKAFKSIGEDNPPTVTAMILATETSEFPVSAEDEKRWGEFVKWNSQVATDKVMLSSTVFSEYASELQGMSTARKLDVIRKYLFKKQNEAEGSTETSLGKRKEVETFSEDEHYEKEEEEEQNDSMSDWLVKYEYTPEHLEVGHDRDDLSVPIYARVNKHASNVKYNISFMVLKGRFEDSDYDFSKRTIKNLHRITFKAEFQKASIEETKAEIFSRFTRDVVKEDPDQLQNPSRTDYQLTRASESDDDDLPGESIIASPRQPMQSPSKSSGSALPAVENAISALRAAEGEIFGTQKDLEAEKAALSKEKLAAEAVNKGKGVEHKKLEVDLKSRAEIIQKQESDLKLRENDLSSLEASLKAREDALGDLELADQSKNHLEKAMAEFEKRKTALTGRELDLNKEKADLVERRNIFKEWQKTVTNDLENRDEPLKKRETTVLERETFLQEREDAIAKREKAVKQREDVTTLQNDPQQALLSKTDDEIFELMKDNKRYKGIFQSNFDIKFAKRVGILKEEQAKELAEQTNILREEYDKEIKKIFSQRDEYSAERTVDSKDNLARPSLQNLPATPAQPFTPSPITVQTPGTFNISSTNFIQLVPQPLLNRNVAFEEHYLQIPAGEPNAGMYMRNSARDLMIDKRWYRVNRILLECTGEKVVMNPAISIDGEKLGEVVYNSGYELDCYVKDEKRKLVQQLGPKSWFFDRSRFFVSWYVYVEIVPSYSL